MSRGRTNPAGNISLFTYGYRDYIPIKTRNRMGPSRFELEIFAV